MVWGGISAHGRTPLVIINGILNAHRYLEEVVRPHVLPFVRGQRRNMTFQQDNARPHVVHHVMNMLVMAWPSMPPDLSPIEHVWDEMDRRLRQRPNQPVTLQGLGKAQQEVWQEIPQVFHTDLVASMRHRSPWANRGSPCTPHDPPWVVPFCSGSPEQNGGMHVDPR